MHKRQLTIVGIVLIAATILFATVAFRQQAQDKTQAQVRTQKDVNQNKNVPIVDFEQKENILLSPDHKPNQQEVEKRLQKNKRFNNRKQVIELPEGIYRTPTSSHWVFEVPAIPIKQSDTIIVGSVKTGRAFLSDDRTGIYSEFSINIERILKSSEVLKEADEIFVERAGGAVRFPNGKVQRIIVFLGQEMPQAGQRYIFFLKKLEDEKNYSILTAYEIRENKINPLDAIEPYTKYDNANSNSFLDKIVEGIKNSDLLNQYKEEYD